MTAVSRFDLVSDLLMREPELGRRIGWAIRQSIDDVLDVGRTGRVSVADLSGIERMYLGSKVEALVRAGFGWDRGSGGGLVVGGQEVGFKWSSQLGGWVFPESAVGRVFLCVTADDEESVFSVGLIEIEKRFLPARDGHGGGRRLTREGLAAVRWLVRDGELPENLLLHLPTGVRRAILAPGLSGQDRVDRLFRLAPGRVVSRDGLATVAQRADGPRCVRSARRRLRPEGILILGDRREHVRIAVGLGLPAPQKGSWVSVRVVPAAPGSGLSVEIGGRLWRRACPDDSVGEAPAA